MEDASDDNRLLDLLVGATAAGKVDPGLALPIVAELLSERAEERPVAGTAAELMERLRDKGGSESEALCGWLAAVRMDEALRFFRSSRGEGVGDDAGRFQFYLGDVPRQVVPGWRLEPVVPAALTRGLEAVEAHALLADDKRAEELPELALGLDGEILTSSQEMRKLGLDAEFLGPELVDQLAGCPKPLEKILRDVLGRFQRRQRERIEGALLVGEFPVNVNERLLADSLMRRAGSGDLSWDEKRSMIVACCHWHTPVMEPVVRELGESDVRLGELAALMLRMRFGDELAQAGSPGQWFSDQRIAYEQAQAAVPLPAAALLRLWLASGVDVGDAARAELDRLVARDSQLSLDELAPRWEALISDQEWGRLFGDLIRREKPSPPATIVPGQLVSADALGNGEGSATPALVPERVEVKDSAPKRKPEGRLPALWAEHVQPFVVENWYMVAGIFMTIVGASLLAFYTWDRHWLIRYTLMPGMLALFTAGLARAGAWIGGKGAEFLGSAAMLRGAAIGLLPVNFMAVALLARDEAVSQKLLAVSVMGLIYVVLAGWGLWRWCRAEHPSLGAAMGGTLLALNSLVALGPMAEALKGGRVHDVVIGLGFYTGFALVAAAVVWFGLRCVDAAMLRGRRVPWFFFVGLAATFLQVFLWVYAGRWPDPHIYAPLVVGAGGLALFFDLRAAHLLGETGARDRLGGVTMLGFGLVILGVVMSMGDGRARVLALFLAGLILVVQALWRSRLAVAHFWIGLTSLALSVASVGLLDAFPKRWLPALGIGFGGICFLLEPFASSLRKEIAEAFGGMRTAALIVSVAVTVLTQWQLKTTPELTALWLVVIACLLGMGARRDRSVRLVHAAMVALAMSIPYWGFVDMRAHDWRGNTVVFGLALLSIGWIGVSSMSQRFPLAARARSTVLWFYGVLAVVAMVIRIYWEGARPAGLAGLGKFMDLGGPLLMAGALIAASYFSRSLVAGGMAAVILVILFPELQATFEEVLPANLWGSGIGSSATALVLVLLSFWCRRARFLRDLPPGDHFLDRYEFPLRRFDHTLATWPLLASAFFLTGKIVFRNVSWFMTMHGLEVLPALALVICVPVCGLLAVYFRRAQGGPVVLVNIALALLVVSSFALLGEIAPLADGAWAWWGFLMVATGLYLLALIGSRRWDWMVGTFERPVFWGLAAWSLVAACAAISTMLVDARVSGPMYLLVISLAGLLVWQELGLQKLIHGGFLFAMALAAVLAAAPDWLDGTLWMLFAVMVVAAVAEFSKRAGDYWWPVLKVEVWLASLLAIVLGVFDLAEMLGQHLGWLGVGVLAMAARAHRSAELVVLALALGYFWVIDALDIEPGYVSMLGGLALLLAISLPIGTILHQRWPKLLFGARPLSPFRGSGTRALVWAAAVCAILSALSYESGTWSYAFLGRVHTPALPDQLAVYSFLALLVLACSKRSLAWGWAALAVSVQVNAHFCDARFGGRLDPWLLFALGAAMSLCVLLLVVELWRGASLKRFASDGLAVLGLAILAALGANFLLSPGFTDADSVSLLVSSGIAFTGARGLRVAARHGMPRLELAYHIALVAMVWCAAFAVPWLRDYRFVLIGIFLPGLYFWWRTVGKAGDRFRPVALGIACLTLTCWLLRDLVAPVLFRIPVLPDDWYHFGAPVVVLAGVLLCRLRSPIGLPAVMVGSYFCATAVPGLTPFLHPDPAAWAAVGLGHLWVLAIGRRSPVRSWAADPVVTPVLIGLVHLAIAVAIARGAIGSPDTLLLLGGASVVLHLAFLKSRYWLHVFGVVEILLALHFEMLFEGWIGAEQIVWILLGLWLLNLLAYDRVIERLAPGGRNLIPLALGVLIFAQVVLVQGAGSWQGIAAVGIAGVLAALTRVSARPMPLSVFLLAIPVWLTFFGLGGPEEFALAHLGALAVALGIGSWARTGGRELNGSRMIHKMLGALVEQGGLCCAAINLIALPAAAGIHFVRLGEGGGFGATELVLLLGIYAAIAISFARHRHLLSRLVANLVVQACAFLIFQALRAQVVATSDLWQPAYDIWATILASFVLVGCRELGSMADRESRESLVFSLCAMPVAGLWMVARHGLGTDAALLVVGLQSIIFAFLGRGSRESPYNIVAVFGFVAFVMMVFWAKLDFRVAHAYVVPAGLGLLALLQLFHRVIPVGTRNVVRLFTLMCMLGSTGYSALLDDRYPVVFHLTMLVLCLACMGLGSLLHVRLYLYLGFTGLLVNLGSILHKVLGSMERGSRMTAIGSLVLIGGILILAAAIYYKTHRGKMDEVVGRWRGRMAAWE